MSTLTVYFALSPTSNSSFSSIPSTSIQPFPMLSTRIKSRPLPFSSLTLPNPPSTSFPTRTSSKKNRTFFERFNPPSPTTITASGTLTSQPTDSMHSSTESQPRLRRRFTFRRSLRCSSQNKGGDNDEGTRSV